MYGCVCVTSVVTCQVQHLVTGVLTTPYDVAFSDVIEGECPDDQRMLMDNGLSFDVIKCTVEGRHGLLNLPQSDCQLSK